MASWVPVPPGSHFPLQNLPYGVCSTAADPRPRPCVAIGDHVLDLRAIRRAGLLAGPVLSRAGDCFEQPTLNAFMALGQPAWREARLALTRLLSAGEGALRDDMALRAAALLPAAAAAMHLPAAIGDYTDFYASREHATNIGIMFRGQENALQPNWLHLPVGYHGRASSIVVSGTGVRRPWGQVQSGAAGAAPRFQPSAALDYELEMGAFIGPGNELGSPIPIDEAEDHIFGYVLVNDWSARDIQRWEYVPLGPFNSKNWATSISPWVVTPAALEPFRCPAPAQEPAPLAYMSQPPGRRHNYAVHLEVTIQPASLSSSSSSSGDGTSGSAMDAGASGPAGDASGGSYSSSCSVSSGPPPPTLAARSSLAGVYWTLPQMIAHHTAGGCALRPGDLLATGTLSARGELGAGCLQERTWGGARPLALADGSQRAYLEDWDRVALSGWCQGDGFCVGFGECTGVVLPALPAGKGGAGGAASPTR